VVWRGIGRHHTTISDLRKEKYLFWMFKRDLAVRYLYVPEASKLCDTYAGRYGFANLSSIWMTRRIMNCDSISVDPGGKAMSTAYLFVHLGDCTTLKQLSILSSCDPNTKDFSSQFSLSLVAYCTDLRSLRLIDCGPHVSSLAFLGSLRQLERVEICKISQRASEDLPLLGNLTGLQEIRLKGLSCSGLDFRNLALLEVLELFDVSDLKDLTGLENCARLFILKLRYCHDLSNISPVRALVKLRCVILTGLPLVSDLTPMTNSVNLESFDLMDCHSVVTMQGLSNCAKLQTVFVYGCQQLVDISDLAMKSSLRHFKLSRCPLLRDLSALGTCPNLIDLELIYWPGTDVSFLGNCFNLESATFRSCHDGYNIDMAVLARCTRLATLTFDSFNKLADFSFIKLCPTLTVLKLCNRGRSISNSVIARLPRLRSNLNGEKVTILTEYDD
jgi:hypothetical protein